MTHDLMTVAPETVYDAEPAWPADLCSFGDWCCTPPELGQGPRVLALRTLGGAALALGTIGVATPLLPTTPFLLVAAWAFARSSPRLEAWLLAHPRLGPPLQAWRRRRAVPRSAKVAAVVSLPASWSGLWLFDANVMVLAVSAAALLGVGGWILSRPS